VDFGYACRCPVRGQVVPVDANINAAGQITTATVTGSANTKAIAFLFDDAFVKNVLTEVPISDIWVKLHGDFVMDVGDPSNDIPARAIDAEFCRAEFPTGDRPAGSKFGIQGGVFESWLRPQRG
jgi:hypothetical protein